MKLEPTREHMDDMVTEFGRAWHRVDSALGDRYPGARRYAGVNAIIDYLNGSGLLTGAQETPIPAPVVGVDTATGSTVYATITGKITRKPFTMPTHEATPTPATPAVGTVYGTSDTIPATVTGLAAHLGDGHDTYRRVPAQPGWFKQGPGWQHIAADGGAIYSLSGLRAAHGRLRVTSVEEPAPVTDDRPVWMFADQITWQCQQVARIDGTDGPDGTVFERTREDRHLWQIKANPSQIMTVATMMGQCPYGVRPVYCPSPDSVDGHPRAEPGE